MERGILTGYEPPEAIAPNSEADIYRQLGAAFMTPGALRTAYENSGARDAVQRGLDTAAYYAGPHLANRAAAVANAVPYAVPHFGTDESARAVQEFRQGNVGRGVGLMGLSTAGALADAIPGEAIAKKAMGGILSGVKGLEPGTVSRAVDALTPDPETYRRAYEAMVNSGQYQ
jgi:hypothetical protein